MDSRVGLPRRASHDATQSDWRLVGSRRRSQPLPPSMTPLQQQQAGVAWFSESSTLARSSGCLRGHLQAERVWRLVGWRDSPRPSRVALRGIQEGTRVGPLLPLCSDGHQRPTGFDQFVLPTLQTDTGSDGPSHSGATTASCDRNWCGWRDGPPGRCVLVGTPKSRACTPRPTSRHSASPSSRSSRPPPR